jgi:hypothetical protein
MREIAVSMLQKFKEPIPIVFDDLCLLAASSGLPLAIPIIPDKEQLIAEVKALLESESQD